MIELYPVLHLSEQLANSPEKFKSSITFYGIDWVVIGKTQFIEAKVDFLINVMIQTILLLPIRKNRIEIRALQIYLDK